jgi:hypothetical protein
MDYQIVANKNIFQTNQIHKTTNKKVVFVINNTIWIDHIIKFVNWKHLTELVLPLHSNEPIVFHVKAIEPKYGYPGLSLYFWRMRFGQESQTDLELRVVVQDPYFQRGTNHNELVVLYDDMVAYLSNIHYNLAYNCPELGFASAIKFYEQCLGCANRNYMAHMSERVLLCAIHPNITNATTRTDCPDYTSGPATPPLCNDCKFYSKNGMLPCAVNPTRTTFVVKNCKDYEALSKVLVQAT